MFTVGFGQNNGVVLLQQDGCRKQRSCLVQSKPIRSSKRTALCRVKSLLLLGTVYGHYFYQWIMMIMSVRQGRHLKHGDNTLLGIA